mgnify:CR=1 FL=1
MHVVSMICSHANVGIDSSDAISQHKASVRRSLDWLERARRNRKESLKARKERKVEMGLKAFGDALRNPMKSLKKTLLGFVIIVLGVYGLQYNRSLCEDDRAPDGYFIAVIATGVGVILLVRRLQRPALEKIAGGKKKRRRCARLSLSPQ